MNRPQCSVFEPPDIDGLRLLALGRIPRCTDCARYLSLVACHEGSAEAPALLPPVPQKCTHAVCAPLVARLASVA